MIDLLIIYEISLFFWYGTGGASGNFISVGCKKFYVGVKTLFLIFNIWIINFLTY